MEAEALLMDLLHVPEEKHLQKRAWHTQGETLGLA